jgi:rare lipoprotein A
MHGVKPLKLFRLLTISTLLAVLVGCSTSGGRYSLKDDKAPERPLDIAHIEDATPKYEKYSLGGNKDYTLRGQRYAIIHDPTNFTQQGEASWYGSKFHGHLTSNGETYDMYSMSAAHKTLPIPSYVKVTNLDNNKTAIVRVNDRGPFHEGRIIDLSYAAATKLDVIKTGTANVKIEHITTTQAPSPKATQHYAIQVAASSNHQRAHDVLSRLVDLTKQAGYLERNDDLTKIFMGPFSDYQTVQTTLKTVKSEGYSDAFITKKRLEK